MGLAAGIAMVSVSEQDGDFAIFGTNTEQATPTPPPQPDVASWTEQDVKAHLRDWFISITSDKLRSLTNLAKMLDPTVPPLRAWKTEYVGDGRWQVSMISAVENAPGVFGRDIFEVSETTGKVAEVNASAMETIACLAASFCGVACAVAGAGGVGEVDGGAGGDGPPASWSSRSRVEGVSDCQPGLCQWVFAYKYDRFSWCIVVPLFHPSTLNPGVTPVVSSHQVDMWTVPTRPDHFDGAFQAQAHEHHLA